MLAPGPLLHVSMTYHMPSLTKKILRGKPYYYLRECQRVNGKPKIISTIYLGTPPSSTVSCVPNRPSLHSGNLARQPPFSPSRRLSKSLPPLIVTSPSEVPRGPRSATTCSSPPSTAVSLPVVRLRWLTGIRRPSCRASCPCPWRNLPVRDFGTTWNASPPSRWRPSSRIWPPPPSLISA